MRSTQAAGAARLPSWVPAETGDYLDHVERGRPIRAIARARGTAPSTVLRRIRRIEGRRDDPLVDEALRAFAPAASRNQESPMTAPDTATVERDARRILRRLTEGGAVLAVARGMQMAAVLREGPGGEPTRTATLARDVARAMALRDWIACDAPSAPVARYRITPSGRAALTRLLEEEAGRRGTDDAPAPAAAEEDGPRRGARYVAETPMAILARRRDRAGKPFLGVDLIAAGERLREDYELARGDGGCEPDALLAEAAGPISDRLVLGGGPKAARARLLMALSELGQGLGDVALRTCCLLEGLETAEKRMGWSARSGKIVLRIALQRLRRHYDATEGRYGAMIG